MAPIWGRECPSRRLATRLPAVGSPVEMIAASLAIRGEPKQLRAGRLRGSELPDDMPPPTDDDNRERDRERDYDR